MWKLKIAEGGSPWLTTKNNYIGRQVWEFDPNLGTGEEIAAVEKAREEYRKNRFKMRSNSDILMRLQFEKENPTKQSKLPHIKLAEHDAVTEEVVSTSLRRALSRISTLQAHDGHWPGDFGGPFFHVPGLVIGLYVTGALNTVLSAEHQREIRRYCYNHQNEDGGWGLYVEGQSTMFGSIMMYVALRLLGEEASGDAMHKGRKWILDHGSAIAVMSWGRLWLSILGVFDWSGGIPFPPEIWLLPYFIPVHPGRMYCHVRLIFQCMSYIYGKRFVGPITPTVLALREELYNIPYNQIDWNKARISQYAKEDEPISRPFIQDIIWASLHKVVEPIMMRWPGKKLRQKALKNVMELIHYEDVNSRYACMNSIVKVLSMICCWVEDPNSEAFKMHLPRIYDHLWLAEDGMNMQAVEGSQLWDATFAIQAIISSGFLEEFGPTLNKAHVFLKESQILEDCPGELSLRYRDISKGSWPFTTRDQGWLVSDCTAEALKVALLLSQISPETVGDAIVANRLYDAVNILLSLMNPNGGFASYELTRSYEWLEIINPSRTFEKRMIDYQCVECTSSVIQALTLFRKLYPGHRKKEIETCIKKAVQFIEKIQEPDGSWYGTWGVCFIYGTWFGVKGLHSVGKTYQNSSCVRKACDFLLSKQLASGGWGESSLSCQTEVYTKLEGNRVNVVSTAWAMLGLLDAGQAERDPEPLHCAAKVLIEFQMENGDFPQQENMGILEKKIMINYSTYRNTFPVWALGEYRTKVLCASNKKH